MIRVAHYTDTVALGGAEEMLLTLLKSLDPRQFESTLMFHPAPAIQPLIDVARNCGIRTVAVERPDTASKLALRLGRALRVERPDICHCHLTWALRCTPALTAGWAVGVRGRVATQQLFVTPGTRARRLRQRLVSTLVHRYIAVSHAMGAEMRRVVLNPGNICVVHNAIDVDRFSGVRDLRLRSALAGASDRPLVLAIARLVPQKGLQHLIAAAAHVPEAVFAVAGEGPERAALEQAAKTAGVSDRFHFLGRRADIPELLAASDVFVLPSLFEGLPVSVLEAMAARTPVVASDVPGTREAVIDRATGLLVAPADAMALARGIRCALNDRALAGRLASNARAHVVEHFSAAAMARAVGRVYQEVLRRRPAESLRRKMTSAAESAP
jgi:glycosyltransferase involved in cell wall biosynthesis